MWISSKYLGNCRKNNTLFLGNENLKNVTSTCVLLIFIFIFVSKVYFSSLQCVFLLFYNYSSGLSNKTSTRIVIITWQNVNKLKGCGYFSFIFQPDITAEFNLLVKQIPWATKKTCYKIQSVNLSKPRLDGVHIKEMRYNQKSSDQPLGCPQSESYTLLAATQPVILTKHNERRASTNC